MKPAFELWPLARVSLVVGLGRSSIYQRIKEGTFPRSVSLGLHCVRWRSDQVATWLETQTAQAESDQANLSRAKKASSSRKLKANSTAVELASHV